MIIQSEKYVDKKLRAEIEVRSGLYIKLETYLFSGLPDRMVLLPGGSIFFAELKTTGNKRTPLQKLIGNKIMKLGFAVYKIDHTDQFSEILKNHE